ncbi:MAG: hypothetical protein JSS87_06975 [Acidobacteria bacterium]|nr:hypothetical protein [Acidobacteriota bacterium]
MKQSHEASLCRIRIYLAVVVLALFVSGVTAFPLETELRWFAALLHQPSVSHVVSAVHLSPWIDRVSRGLIETNARYPFLAYGTDWLAFAHVVLAILFAGAMRDPVRNKWVLQFGLIACAGVLPLALIAGPIRGIPFGWRLIDCSFGIFGCIPMLIALRDIKRIEAI